MLFLLGYGLALPLASRLTAIVSGQQRLAFAGHQVGVVIALLGWMVRGSFVMAVLHLIWVIAARIWYAAGERDQGKAAPAEL